MVEPKRKRLKVSLAGTLVRTLLIFTFIPLALMAGAAYYRAQSLLRDQALRQSEVLMGSQLEVINRQAKDNEAWLEHLTASSDFNILTVLALNVNPNGSEFREIRSSIIKEFNNGVGENGPAVFDQFFITDDKGLIKVASNPDWQGVSLADASILNGISPENSSTVVYGLSPLYDNQLVLLTAEEYKVVPQGSTLGFLVGIIEPRNLSELFHPLVSLYPLARTYYILPTGQLVSAESQTGDLTMVKTPTSSQKNLIARMDKLRVGEETSSPTPIKFTTVETEAAVNQLQWLPSMHTGVAFELSKEIIYGNLNSLIPFTVALTVFLLAATGLVVLLGTNRVIKPLSELSEITQKFAEGDWNQRAKVANEDEVGLLAKSFNHMADELSGLYKSLEEKVDERTRQIRTAAEVAQNITAHSNLDEMLDKTLELLVKQFGFYQASVFMLDRSGKYIQFKTGHGAATSALAEKKSQIEVGSNSIIGWVGQNNQLRVASDIMDDSLHLKNELLPQTRAEAALPITIGNVVLGVLDVQSTQPSPFNSEAIVTLQTMASQIAAAVQTAGLSESTQINFEELLRLYRSSRSIASANSEEEIFKTCGLILRDSPFTVLIIAVRNNLLEVLSASNNRGVSIRNSVPSSLETGTGEIEKFLLGGSVVISGNEQAPVPLRAFTSSFSFASTGYLAVNKENALAAIIILGSNNRILNDALIQPYANLADLISITLEKVDMRKQTERHLREVESLASISEAISTASDLPSFFTALHEKIKQVVGNFSFIIALYDEMTDTISIPYSYENDKFLSIEPFPLGEGLTSILIRSQQPLLLAENTERRAAELGAKILGKPAKSWMGTPMLVQNKPVGALIIQDTEREFAFDQDDMTFFTTLASQVAGVINNVRLLEESNRRAVQLESAAIIARDISGSLNLDELLIKAVNLIREQFDFYHAAVFLHDLPGEFAVIREATGEAGAQMKRQGHKIGVGSKSIVSFVAGRGETLVINDTTKDATYLANPLLPDTRAEAAFALKVGERILGVLDVQSTIPYAFNDDNLRSLQILADQLAIAVVNTELFAETQEHLSQHRLLHHITTTVASGTTLEEALESAVNGLQVTLGGDRIMILLVDREKKYLEAKASIGFAGEATRVRIPVGNGVVGWVAAQKKPLRLRDVSEDSRYIQISPNTRSELALPLIYRNELLGVLNAESELLDAYTENDVEMLGTLAGSLAAIIANARLLEQIRLQVERERLIYEVTSKIRRSTDIQSILSTTASELTRITGSKQTRIKIAPVDDGNTQGS